MLLIIIVIALFIFILLPKIKDINRRADIAEEQIKQECKYISTRIWNEQNRLDEYIWIAPFSEIDKKNMTKRYDYLNCQYHLKKQSK